MIGSGGVGVSLGNMLINHLWKTKRIPSEL